MITHLNRASRFPERVVILGSSGFLGQAWSRSMKRENGQVVEVSSKEVDLAASTAKERLLELLRPGDTVVFLAALTPDKGKDHGTLMKNMAMACGLSDALEKARIGHLVYMSSDAVYGDSNVLIRETSPASSGQLYGHMHLGRELILGEACRKSQIPFLVLRPCAIYGASDTHNSYGPNRFMRMALSDGVIRLFGQGEEKRDHLFIDDLCEILSRVVSQKSQGVLNLATGDSWSFFEIARALVTILASEGPKIRIENLPRSSPVVHRHFDTSALMRAFPDFRFTSLREGLLKLLDPAGERRC